MSNLCSRLSWIPADIFSVCISPGSDRFCHCDPVSGWCPSENRGGKSCMLSPLKQLHPVQGVQRLHQTHGASWGPSHSDVTSGRQSSLLHYGNHPCDCTGMQVFFQQHATSLYSTKCSKIRKALWRKNLVHREAYYPRKHLAILTAYLRLKYSSVSADTLAARRIVSDDDGGQKWHQSSLFSLLQVLLMSRKNHHSCFSSMYVSTVWRQNIFFCNSSKTSQWEFFVERNRYGAVIHIFPGWNKYIQ